MKKLNIKINIIIFIAMLFLFTSCQKNENIEFTDIPDNYSLEEAVENGCVVYYDGDIFEGQDIWDKFVEMCAKKEECSVRLAFYYTLGNPDQYSPELYEEIKDDYPVLYINDLKYDGEKYIHYYKDAGKYYKTEYKYMKKFEGEPLSQSALYSSYIYYVLLNDDKINWKDIEHGMFSSQGNAWIDHFRVYSNYNYKNLK